MFGFETLLNEKTCFSELASCDKYFFTRFVVSKVQRKVRRKKIIKLWKFGRRKKFVKNLISFLALPSFLYSNMSFVSSKSVRKVYRSDSRALVSRTTIGTKPEWLEDWAIGNYRNCERAEPYLSSDPFKRANCC